MLHYVIKLDHTCKLSRLFDRVHQNDISGLLVGLVEFGFIDRQSGPDTFGLRQSDVFSIVTFHQEKSCSPEEVIQLSGVVCKISYHIEYGLLNLVF